MCYKFLLPYFFATLHLRALPEIFVLHYYFFPGNASVLVDPEQSLGAVATVPAEFDAER